jgi:uncharacterized protein
MRHIPQAEYRAMPWKNGAGTTTEIFAHPAGQPDFDWRASIAAVAADGPFSSFAGYDRHIMLLSGDGMRLEFAGQGAVDLRAHEPFSFSGEAVVSARLIAGPVRDFNLIVRRGFGVGQLRMQSASESDEFGSDASSLLIHALGGDSLYLEAGERGGLKGSTYMAICQVTPISKLVKV